MKKIAICISGIPRSSYCVETIKRISKYNEVFLFIWNWNDASDQIRINSWRRYPADKNFDAEIFRSKEFKLFYDSGSFQDMSFVFSKNKSEIKLDKSLMREDLGVYGMTYAIMKSNEMREEYEKEKNIIFDCVMRARFELCFVNNDGVFRVEDFDMNKLWISHTNQNKDGMSDCLAFSNSETMSYYSKVYNRIKELSEIEYHNPESIFHHHTKHLNRVAQYVLRGF